MGSESRSALISVSSPASSSSPSGKRSRDPEDEVYLDNLRSQKRYLSEIMACSLNGLTVGDSLPVNMLESPSPARSETFLYHRDELPLQYSPMSEDSDETRFCCEDPTITTTSTCSSQPESRPTSPVSPYRYQKPFTPTTTATTTTTQSRRPSDTEGRFPSSPSDICHSSDLRRTALLRSVQMRTQPCGGGGYSSSSSGTSSNIVDVEERMILCCNKSMEVEEEEEERGYNNRGVGEEEIVSYGDQVSGKSKSCKVLDMKLCEM